MPASAATLVTLASFDNNNGASPRGGLTIDAAGNIYGGASQGGINTSGVVFKIDAGTSTMTTIARFNGTNGAGPIGGVAMDAAGNLYGATQTGGAGGLGTIYRIAAGTNTITTLAAFRNGDGANPWGRVTLDAAGNIYGTTASGGQTNQGTVFRLAAGATSITTLASFTGPNGSMPYAPLVLDKDGNLFGTASAGGSNGRGTIFKVAAGTNAVSTVANFTNTTGYTPNGGLLLDDAGNLYGTTWRGGSINRGTVFRLSDAGFVTAAAAVPEPASWAMMMIGFGLLGGNLRCRRHRGIAVAA